MRNLVVSILCLSATACSGSIINPIEPGLTWETLKDGSKLAVGPTDKNAIEAASLIRCWNAGGAFDCVAIQGDEWRDVRRTRPAALPTKIWGGAVPIGYDCSIGHVGSGYQEHVTGKHGRLTEHVSSGLFGPMEPSWSGTFVTRYFEANMITPETHWFDCRALAKVVQQGSTGTLGSSSVTRDLLDGKLPYAE